MEETKKIVLTRLPREPFLQHSEVLLQKLLSGASTSKRPTILEIGCGRQSPLIAVLERLFPNGLELIQIDARQEVVEEARRHAPQATVEQAFAHSLPFIEDDSIDFIVGMSVFDQNPIGMMPAIAKELRRILKPDGSVSYIHNEEVNLPAFFASCLTLDEPRYLIPSPNWRPTNDTEFCLAPKTQVDAAMRAAGSKCKMLAQYLGRLMPPQNPTQKQINVPLSAIFTPQNLQLMQQEAVFLQQMHAVTMADVPTSALISSLLEANLFSAERGFEAVCGGVFEIQRAVDWRECFASRPNENCFARGITRFGVASRERLETRSDYRQEINQLPEPISDDEILLTAYQYGLSARKV